MEILKADWALFKIKFPKWQEAYMNRLSQEYIALLSSNQPSSTKFWALEKRIKQDKKSPGIQIQLQKSEMLWDLVALIHDGVITESDLSDFSEELRQQIHYILSRG